MTPVSRRRLCLAADRQTLPRSSSPTDPSLRFPLPSHRPFSSRPAGSAQLQSGAPNSAPPSLPSQTQRKKREEKKRTAQRLGLPQLTPNAPKRGAAHRARHVPGADSRAPTRGRSEPRSARTAPAAPRPGRARPGGLRHRAPPPAPALRRPPPAAPPTLSPPPPAPH